MSITQLLSIMIHGFHLIRIFLLATTEVRSRGQHRKQQEGKLNKIYHISRIRHNVAHISITHSSECMFRITLITI